MKRCIFHYPHPIDDKPGIGSALRPNQMQAAFAAIGYQVDVISGYSRERAEAIRRIKENIRTGVKYDFVYSESVNIPTALTDADHIPRRPCLDSAFFRFCRKAGIPVGLFYRDMHWRFPVYTRQVAWWKQLITQPLFRWDLWMYKRFVDVLYVPSAQLGELLPGHDCRPLPPGGARREDVLARRQEKQPQPGSLRVFYVGNVLGVYDLTAFCEAVHRTENVYLTICVPQTSWETAKKMYEPYLCHRIQVIHKTSSELQSYYEEADVCCCCLQENDYTRLAMPIKTFEAVSYGVPVMMTRGIAASRLIDREGWGWNVENSTADCTRLLTHLLENPEEVRQKTENALAAAPAHTWQSRAQQVADELTNLKK